jgi:hypothetical protein
MTSGKRVNIDKVRARTKAWRVHCRVLENTCATSPDAYINDPAYKHIFKTAFNMGWIAHAKRERKEDV